VKQKPKPREVPVVPDDCCNSCCEQPAAFRPVLWIALGINLAMFVVEIGAAFLSGSNALQADALDFLGDAANYAVSLGVAGLAVRWRARAALIKGSTMGAFGLWIIASAIWHSLSGMAPEPRTMGTIGLIAMIANGGVALMLYRFRTGDANMRSVWLCARNDVLGNVAVILAAVGVFGTGRRWPDTVVALVMAFLALSGAWMVNRQAIGELRTARP
jgi:Co/Zn/Cd efflux system component